MQGSPTGFWWTWVSRGVASWKGSTQLAGVCSQLRVRRQPPWIWRYSVGVFPQTHALPRQLRSPHRLGHLAWAFTPWGVLPRALYTTLGRDVNIIVNTLLIFPSRLVYGTAQGCFTSVVLYSCQYQVAFNTRRVLVYPLNPSSIALSLCPLCIPYKPNHSLCISDYLSSKHPLNR